MTRDNTALLLHYRVEKKEEISTLLFNILRVVKSYKILEIQVFRTPIC